MSTCDLIPDKAKPKTKRGAQPSEIWVSDPVKGNIYGIGGYYGTEKSVLYRHRYQLISVPDPDLTEDPNWNSTPGRH